MKFTIYTDGGTQHEIDAGSNVEAYMDGLLLAFDIKHALLLTTAFRFDFIVKRSDGKLFDIREVKVACKCHTQVFLSYSRLDKHPSLLNGGVNSVH